MEIQSNLSIKAVNPKTNPAELQTVPHWGSHVSLFVFHLFELIPRSSIDRGSLRGDNLNASLTVLFVKEKVLSREQLMG